MPAQSVDVEKHCGVPLADDTVCNRGLTCKAHSMRAKRAVPGRSAPYDMLLAQCQEQQKAKKLEAEAAAASASQ